MQSVCRQIVKPYVISTINCFDLRVANQTIHCNVFRISFTLKKKETNRNATMKSIQFKKNLISIILISMTFTHFSLWIVYKDLSL